MEPADLVAHLIRPGAPLMDDLVTHLRAEIARLTTLHRAELEYGRRMGAAYALARSAAELGNTALWNLDGDGSKCDRDDIQSLLTRADALAVPTAAGVPL